MDSALEVVLAAGLAMAPEKVWVRQLAEMVLVKVKVMALETVKATATTI